MWIPWLVAAIAVVIALAIAVWSRGSRSVAQPTASPAIRFAIPPPAGGAFWDNFENAPLAMSPDGSQLAFIATDAERVQRVWLRPLAAIDAHAVPDTDGASGVLWSPDSRSIAFFAEGKLKRIDLPGGAAVTLCEYKGSPGMSGSWGRGGDILFASVAGDAIYRVPASGGTPAVERKRDSAHGEQRAGFPWYLPDGRRYLYSTRLANTARVMLSEEGREPRPILEVTTNAQFVEPDYLVFVRDGTLIAQRFDADRATVVGAAFSIAASVRYFYSTAAARFATAPGGAIAYHTFFDEERLVWVDRTGAETGTVGTPGLFISLRISPDGSRVLFSRAQPQLRTFDLWTADLARGGELRLTSDPTSEVNGLWHPDGRSIYFSVDRDGAPHVYRKDLTTGREVEVLAAGGLQTAEDFTPDGRTLVFSERPGASADLWTQPIDGGPRAPLLQTRFSEAQVRFSPDGRYLAFASNETGRNETYVSAYPPTGEKAAISLAGGTQPRWSHDGRELFFVGADRRLMVVPIRTAPTLSVGTPTALFRLPGRRTWKDYDVSADGRRFLAIVTDVLGDERPLTLVTNWKAEVPH